MYDNITYDWDSFYTSLDMKMLEHKDIIKNVNRGGHCAQKLVLKRQEIDMVLKDNFWWTEAGKR